MRKKINWIYNARPFETVSEEKYLLCVNRFGQLTIGQWKDEIVFRNNHTLFHKYDVDLNYNIENVYNRINKLRIKHSMMIDFLVFSKLRNIKESETRNITERKIKEHYSYHSIFLNEENFDSSIHEIDDGFLKNGGDQGEIKQ